MRRRTLACSLGLLTLLGGCAAPAPDSGSDSASVHPSGYGAGLPERVAELPPGVRPFLPQARRIAAQSLVIDTHIDVPYRVERGFADVTSATPDGDFDWPRAVAGGLDAPFMSIYIPADVDAADQGEALALRLIGIVEDIVARAPDRFALANAPEDVVANWRAGRISLPMGMENCGPIRDPADAKTWAARGIRYCTLAHSRSNALADSSYDPDERWQGLSPLGERMVPALNDAGIMIDVSHLSDAAALEAMTLSSVPVIASHSAARHFVPGFARNLDDDLIRAIGAAGGVVQINFGSTFISAASRASAAAGREAFQDWLQRSGVEPESEQAAAWRARWQADHPLRRATLAEVLDQFDYVAGLAGIDHVGIGTDYDGVGDSLPDNLRDVASYPHLIAGLLSRGWSEEEIRKVLGGNLLRVWRLADAHARGVAGREGA